MENIIIGLLGINMILFMIIWRNTGRTIRLLRKQSDQMAQLLKQKQDMQQIISNLTGAQKSEDAEIHLMESEKDGLDIIVTSDKEQKLKKQKEEDLINEVLSEVFS